MGSSKFLECIHYNVNNMVMHTPSTSDAEFTPSSPDSRVILTRRASAKEDEGILGKQGEEFTQCSKMLMCNLPYVSEIPNWDFAAVVHPYTGVTMISMDSGDNGSDVWVELSDEQGSGRPEFFCECVDEAANLEAQAPDFTCDTKNELFGVGRFDLFLHQKRSGDEAVTSLVTSSAG